LLLRGCAFKRWCFRRLSVSNDVDGTRPRAQAVTQSTSQIAYPDKQS
jgi:hypothetical protein